MYKVKYAFPGEVLSYTKFVFAPDKMTVFEKMHKEHGQSVYIISIKRCTRKNRNRM